jgi:DNA-nicking Smr family endonuclease
MPRRSPRKLTEDEQILWNKVVKQVAAVENMPVPIEKPHPIRIIPESPLEIKAFRMGAKVKTKPVAHHPPSFVDRPSQTSPNMDRRNFQRLLKGQLDIDSTLDLHGMTAEQARAQLHIYIQSAHHLGHRLLLIITGKGNKKTVDEFNRPRSGVLKTGVPEWLKTGPHSHHILQVTQAHMKHGGGGAFYVYLRRKR